MKKMGLILLSGFFLASIAFAVDIPLKATWTPNTEADMAGYNLYRTDGIRIKLNSSLIPHPPSLPYLFSITVPDGSEGVAKFILTAVDDDNNESADSETANYPFDFKAPGVPGGFGVSKP